MSRLVSYLTDLLLVSRIAVWHCVLEHIQYSEDCILKSEQYITSHSIECIPKDIMCHSYFNSSIGQVGPKRAREMWFLSWFYSANEADKMGLVNTVVPVSTAKLSTELVP